MSGSSGQVTQESSDPGYTTQLLEDWGRILEGETAEDLSLVQQIYEEQDEIKAICERKEAHFKELIRTLSGGVEELKQQTSGTEAGKLNAKLAALTGSKEQTQQHISSLKRDIAGVEKNTELARISGAQLLIDTRNAKAELETKVHALESNLKLCTSVSHIIWDLDASPGDIKGTSHMVQKKSVKTFSYAVGAQSQVQLADKLWDMMWADHD